jgi:hypothetical protein
MYFTVKTSSYAKIDAGAGNNCGLKKDGQVICWGWNKYNQTVPFDSDITGKFTQISAGYMHSCGVNKDGSVDCWGRKDYGQTNPPNTSFKQVSAGGWHTCGVKTNNTLACWGYNADGRATPPGGQFSQVSASLYHTCGVRLNGSMACWGDNTFGQSAPPSRVFSQVSAGGFHTCGLEPNGDVRCWGLNDDGQSTVPNALLKDVSTGFWHTCGVKKDGSLACWGWDGYDQATPPMGIFKQAAAGAHHSCALSVGGTYTCWGRNNDGQAPPPEEVPQISPWNTMGENTPEYTWSDVFNASEYQLKVKNSTGSIVLDKWYSASTSCTNGTCSVTPSSALSKGSYQWSIRAKNNQGNGNWSAWLAFKYGLPETSTPVSPNTTIGDAIPTYQWDHAIGTATYKLMVYSYTSASMVIDKTVNASNACTFGECRYIPTTKLTQGNYRFKVRPRNGAGWGPTSAWLNFKVSKPGMPTLISPSSVTGDCTPTFEWNEVDLATVYKLSVYSKTTSSYVLSKNVTTSTACSGGTCTYTPSNQLPLGDYRFKVSGKNSVGWGPVSSWINFSISQPAVPTLISPSGVTGDRTPSYKWNEVDGATMYKMSVYSFDTSAYVLIQNVVASTTCSGGTCVYTPTSQLPLGDYRFKVSGKNALGWGPVSSWMSFSISKPVVPALISPSGTIGTGTPKYNWNVVDGATKYRLSVYSIDTSTYVLTQNLVASSVCSGTACSFTQPTGLTLGNYRFKVSGYNALGWGPVPQWHHQRHHARIYLERIGWRNTIQTDVVLDRQREQCAHHEPALQRHLFRWGLFLYTTYSIECGGLQVQDESVQQGGVGFG